MQEVLDVIGILERHALARDQAIAAHEAVCTQRDEARGDARLAWISFYCMAIACGLALAFALWSLVPRPVPCARPPEATQFDGGPAAAARSALEV